MEDSKKKDFEVALMEKWTEFIDEVVTQWDNIDWAKSLGVDPMKDRETLLHYCHRIRNKS